MRLRRGKAWGLRKKLADWGRSTCRKKEEKEGKGRKEGGGGGGGKGGRGGPSSKNFHWHKPVTLELKGKAKSDARRQALLVNEAHVTYSGPFAPIPYSIIP